MLFMVIETFEKQDMIPIYRRLQHEGRMLSEGQTYVAIWIVASFGCCFQLMECDDARLFQEWCFAWRGTGVTFKIVPVDESNRTHDVVAPHLDGTET